MRPMVAQSCLEAEGQQVIVVFWGGNRCSILCGRVACTLQIEWIGNCEHGIVSWTGKIKLHGV